MLTYLNVPWREGCNTNIVCNNVTSISNSLVLGNDNKSIGIQGGNYIDLTNLVKNLETTTFIQSFSIFQNKIRIGYTNEDGNTLFQDINISELISSDSLNGLSTGTDGKLFLNNLLLDKHYYHVQQTPSSTWVINHNLNKFPSVTILDSSFNKMIAEVFYNNLNTITINFYNNSTLTPQVGYTCLN